MWSSLIKTNFWPSKQNHFKSSYIHVGNHATLKRTQSTVNGHGMSKRGRGIRRTLSLPTRRRKRGTSVREPDQTSPPPPYSPQFGNIVFYNAYVDCWKSSSIELLNLANFIFFVFLNFWWSKSKYCINQCVLHQSASIASINKHCINQQDFIMVLVCYRIISRYFSTINFSTTDGLSQSNGLDHTGSDTVCKNKGPFTL